MEVITIDERFCGPPGSGNGGYVAGLLARRLGTAAEVTLRRPVPLGRSLPLARTDGGIELRDGETVLARAEAANPAVEPPPAVSLEDARQASARFPRADEHPLPHCFVCGTARGLGDGLRIFPGPVSGDSDVVAGPWVPDATLAGPDGLVREEFLWASLDCTGAFATNEPPRGLMLLGRLAAEIRGPLRAGEPVIVTGWPLADQGRKIVAGTALRRADGGIVAVARATWVFVEGPTAPAPWRRGPRFPSPGGLD